MCGICGYIGFNGDKRLLHRMTDVITHRGPDDKGYFLSEGVGLGMRRLSIIDLKGGKQPIINEGSDIVIIFNGEIYNYKALREKLIKKGHRFKTKSDTETILHLYENYGKECVHHLDGMFAFAVFDTKQKQLFLARDRLGIKPLYYWFQGGKLLFGSEIKSILECEIVSRQPNLNAIDNFLSLRYVPGPETMFMGINKLPAGHWMLWNGGEIKVERYWTPTIYSGNYKHDAYYYEQFSELFSQSVKKRFMSEVPFGAYLSGGVDSSTIVATMSQMMEIPVKTFSVGFDWPGDELPVAREVAERLGCDHHEVICESKDFEKLPQIIWNLDEPLGDAIIVPMYILSRLARKHVTVVLSGEGADETLAGYLFHKPMMWSKHYTDLVPELLRKGFIEPLIKQLPSSLINKVFDYPGNLGDRGRKKILDYLELIGKNNPSQEYRFLLSLFDKRDKDTLYCEQLKLNLTDNAAEKEQADKRGHYLDRILSLQYKDWLPDDILTKQDKLSMANSIEARVPFMDHTLVEFLFQVPPHLKLNKFKNKILLRNHLSKLLPQTISQQKKKAFYIPTEKYLSQGKLHEITNICLSEESIRKRGYFNWDLVRKLRLSVEDGEFLYGKQVFSLVTLELWHRIFIDQESGWIS